MQAPVLAGHFAFMAGFADLLELFFKGKLIKRFNWQIGEDADALEEHAHGIGKGKVLFSLSALDCGRVWHAPVGGHRLAGPDGAGLVGGVITYGEDEMQLRCAFALKLFPAL